MIGFLAIASISASSDKVCGVDAGGGSFLLPHELAGGDVQLARGCFSCAAVQGVFKYSMMVGSTPFSRSSARVLREVLQRGLWYIVTGVGTFLLQTGIETAKARRAGNARSGAPLDIADWLRGLSVDRLHKDIPPLTP